MYGKKIRKEQIMDEVAQIIQRTLIQGNYGVLDV